LATTAKRTSGHAALDDSMRSSSDSSDSLGSPRSTAQFTFRNEVRRIKPMPKRARLLQPASAVPPPEPNVQPSSSNATSSTQSSDSPSSESSSPLPAPALRSSERLRDARRDLRTSRSVRDVRDGVDSSSSEFESDDDDERRTEIYRAYIASVIRRDTQDASATHIPARSILEGNL